ncbi:MAG: hypothetical protein ACYST6_05710 [Planctomycetota bacterium]|jgi:hypothetical protein
MGVKIDKRSAAEKLIDYLKTTSREREAVLKAVLAKYNAGPPYRREELDAPRPPVLHIIGWATLKRLKLAERMKQAACQNPPGKDK